MKVILTETARMFIAYSDLVKFVDTEFAFECAKDEACSSTVIESLIAEIEANFNEAKRQMLEKYGVELLSHSCEDIHINDGVECRYGDLIMKIGSKTIKILCSETCKVKIYE